MKRSPFPVLRSALLIVCALAVGGCRRSEPGAPTLAGPAAGLLDRAAESYVRLALALDRHDPGYVDAYYGPPQWKAEVEAKSWSLQQIKAAATTTIGELKKQPPTGGDELVRLRNQYLLRHLDALSRRVDMRAGARFNFDEEAQALFDVTPPAVSEAQLEPLLAELDRRLPGNGPLVARYEAFRNRFVVPRSRLDAVFTRALEACRERTRARIGLPEGERLRLEYVSGQPWSAYTRYRGNYESVIQINRDLPVPIDRVIDVGCHEGYPGHHVHNVLLERRFVRECQWVEFTVAPLFSPQALLAEGLATFGIEVAFSTRDRAAFERDVLFPLAGLDPRAAESYAAVHQLIDRLAVAAVEGARRYLDATLDARAATRWLERYAVMPRPDAMLEFIDRYRSYVTSYTVGRDLVRRYVEARGGTAERPDERWKQFKRLLGEPRLPSDLK